MPGSGRAAAGGWRSIVAHSSAPTNLPTAGRSIPTGGGWWRANGRKSAFVVPVMHDGELLADLPLNGREPFDVDGERWGLMGSFTARAAIALRNASLCASLEAADVALEQAALQATEPAIAAQAAAP
jgi:GAF domain-containing protein